MTETLHALLASDRPAGLDRIERTLAAQEDRSDDLEAILSALIWRRRTEGRTGLIGTFIHKDCIERLDVLADHLETIGAVEAATAVRELTAELPLGERRLPGGFIDWVDTQPEFVAKARRLDTDLDDIDPVIWRFMKGTAADLPDLPLEAQRQGFLSRMRLPFVGQRSAH